jgi:hypothetical protein
MSNRKPIITDGDYLLHLFMCNLAEKRRYLNELSYRLERAKPEYPPFDFEKARETTALRKLYRELLTDPNEEVQKDCDEERQFGWGLDQ